jgi:hypothetical protein
MAKKSKTTTQDDPRDFCLTRQLPEEMLLASATKAVEVNPANAPPVEQLQILLATALVEVEVMTPQRIAVLTGKYFGSGGVDLTVGFTEQINPDLRDRILSHLNCCSDGPTPFANIRFRWTQSSPQVRITREGQGYWSYVGTDVLFIRPTEPTMCLQGFTMSTPESEYRRVVRHEMLHTAGCPHEHMRGQIISRLDVAKTIAWGRNSLGWNEAAVRSQILTPLSEASIRGTPQADDDSIMCYSFPASITKDGKKIVGGADLTPNDRDFLAGLYPLTIAPPPPPPPPPPPGGGWAKLELLCDLVSKKAIIRVPSGFTLEERKVQNMSDKTQSCDPELESLAGELEASLAPAGAQHAIFGGVFGAGMKVVAAIRAGDYLGAWRAFRELMDLLIPAEAIDPNDPIVFKAQQAALFGGGKFMELLIKIFGKLLPLIL